MLAIVLASACREKLGGDHVDDARAALDACKRLHRLEALVDQPALVFIGLMGRATSAARAAAALGERARRFRRGRRGAPRQLDRGVLLLARRAAFREAEEETVCELLERRRRPCSRSGGSIASERVRGLLSGHTVRAARRRRGDRVAAAGGRALAATRSLLGAARRARTDVRLAGRCRLLAARATSSAAPRRHPALRDAPRHAADLGDRESGQYPVYVGGGLIDAGFRRSKGVAWSSPTATPAAVRRSRGRVPRPSRSRRGRSTRTSRTAGSVLERLADAGLDHDGHVIALGGGVVGDLARLLRGGLRAQACRSCRCRRRWSRRSTRPTAARPGSTCRGQELRGVYHQPAAVLADPAALATLPPEELAAGWAEVVKTALIAGGTSGSACAPADAEPDRDLVLACARTKLAVVAADERDGGRRQALNLGHTVGHAIETVTGYRRYRHGEAGRAGPAGRAHAVLPAALREEAPSRRHRTGRRRAGNPAIDRTTLPRPTGRDKKRRSGRVGIGAVEAARDIRTGCTRGGR